MKAWVLHDIGDIRLEEVSVPLPKPGEVLIKVMAAGICGSDIPRIYENGAHRMPLIPGHEFSGIVEGIGKGTSELWLGKRVGVYPLIPCGECQPCRSGHPEMCRNYDYIGSRRDGAFSEYVTVPAANLIELPKEVSFEDAAMLEPMAVAVHAMRMMLEMDGLPPQKDGNIVVCGLGTIGLLITMFLLEYGCKEIYVIGNKKTQKQRAMEIGVPPDHFCDSSETDAAAWIRETMGGADVFFECVGKPECISLGIDAAAPLGRVILVGNPFSDVTLDRDIYWKILRNQLSVKGVWNSAFLNGDFSEENPDDWHDAMRRLSKNRLNPNKLITHRFSIDELEKGFHIMREKTEDYCKVMMVN